MFNKILIANRGEIAVRVIRACYEMGIRSVAVYSQADRDALHVQMADEAVCIGASAPRDSYLNFQNVLSATVLTGAEAIHPGYGLLSENAKFAQICEKCNIVFIGPPYRAIEDMGDKMLARRTMINNGVPVIPGSDGALNDIGEARAVARKVGFPLLIKASAGGGGRGIRRVNSLDELESAIHEAKTEALACFGDDSVYIEKLMENVRHIEIQLLADKFGNVIHLFERDCSLQRKRQKVVEEAPSAYISAELRKKMGEAAIRAARACNYTNAGTVEFLVDAYHNFYFMEMNTRVQVEHPVTEAVTGVDIVAEQIRVAAGLPLSVQQRDVRLYGHSIECRINAEQPEKGFMPSCGKVNIRHLPGGIGVRFDSLLYDGWEISPYYDSMIGKLIVHAPDRNAAIARMKRALMELSLEGIEANDDFLFDIITHPDFQSNHYDTSWIEKLQK